MTMIAPSLLAADFSAMGEQLRRVQQAEAVHIDIMDGNFVPNLSMGPQMVEALRPQSSQIFDVHLMLLHPLPYVPVFRKAGADWLTFHVECADDPEGVLRAIEESGAKPGMVIGKGGAEIEKLKKLCESKLGGKEVSLNIVEVKQPDLDAQLVAENIASQLERRVSFRRALKQSIGRTMRLGARGIKTQVSGRLGGAEIARTEQYHEGTIPLQTIRADIDYGFAEAKTTYGRIGVKVWIYKGEVLHDNRSSNNRRRSSRKEGGAR